MIFGLASASNGEKLNAGLLRPGRVEMRPHNDGFVPAVPLSNGPATLTEGLMVVW